MRRGLTGYATLTVPGEVVQERETFTCCHCQSIVHVRPFQRDFTRCSLCDALICPKCVGQKCVPFEKRLAAMEARRSYED
jgi:hypothetical protein